MACLEGRNFTIKLYPRKKARFSAGGGAGQLPSFPWLDPSAGPPDRQGEPSRLSDDRQQIPADCPVQGKGAAAEAEKSEAGRPDHQREFQVEKNGRGFPDGEKRARHDEHDADSRKAREEAEKKCCAEQQFGDHNQRGNHRRKAEPGRRRPRFNRPMPSDSSKPAKSHLGSMKEKYSRGRHPKNERTCISRGVEEMEDGIVRHGATH